jgi:NIMA-interacting peptidyl-prolyl cis-trans isomerase 1
MPARSAARLSISLFLSTGALVALALVGCDKPKDTASSSAASASASAPTATASAPASASSTAPTSATAEAKKVETTPPTAITAQHVLVAWKGAERAPKTVTRSKADAKKRAEDVFAKAKAGGDFSALVSEYSDDPAAKERMGSVGKFTREKMAKPFSDAAFALAVDEVSSPVETPFGFHVIKRNQ